MANPTVQLNDGPQNFDDVLYQFEKAFRQGRNPDPASFAQCEGLDRVRLLMELLHSDLELRIRAGQPIRVSDYVTRYPEISQQPDKMAAILETEIRLREQMGKNPTAKEYESVYGEALGPRLHEIFNRLQMERETSQNAGKSTDTVEYKRAGPQQLPKHIGRFIILSLLGEGAFGRVYQARDPELEREVAIKVPRLAAGTANFDVNQFLREAKAAATIQHPNVCPVYEAGVHEGQPYIVMAYIPGKSLAEVLQNRQPPPGKQVALIIRKLALALQAAHDKGVIHRDLKPSNILFDQYRKDVIVTDFGLARRDGLGNAQQTKSGVVMGTPAYMSPEQARGDSKQVGPAADIYSLGVILYELLTGQRPFTGSVGEVIGKVQHVDPVPPSKVRAEADPYLELICQKAMAKHPADRYSSMRALAETLTEYLHGIPPEPVVGQPNQAATASQETTGFADLIAAALAEQKTEMSAALEAAVSKARIPLWKIMLPMGLLAVFGLVMLGLFLFTRPAVVPFTLQLDVDLNDKELSFFLDDKPIEPEKLAGPIELTEGQHILIVKRGERIIRRYVLDVKRGMSPILKPEDTLAPHWPMSPGVPPATVHYTLDGHGQAMLNDARRRASVGKVVGNVQSVSGIISQAAGLEGKNDQYLEIQDTDALHITGLFTAATWVNGKNDKATILSRWGTDGYAFCLSTGVADGIEPKGDIAPAIMPNVPPPAPMKAPPAMPPSSTMLHPATMAASTYTLLTMPGQPPAGQPPVGVAAAPTKPAAPTNFKTNIIEFVVNFGPKDKEEGAVSVKATYDPESWTHVAATFDGHFLRLYLNGYLAAETCLADDPVMRKLMDEGKASLPASIASSKAPLVMGQGFAGQLDDVMLFDAALTDKELKRLIHFNTTRELATPPGQWVALAAEEADLAHARLTSKLGENVNFYGNALQLENKAEVKFPFRAKNFVVSGSLQRASSAGGDQRLHAGILRLRHSGASAYGGYITGDGHFGLIKETNGQAADLTSKQFALMEITCARCRTREVDGKKVSEWYTLRAFNPVQIALATHGDRLAWFINGQPFLERKDDALKVGGLSLSALDNSAIEISSLQVCVLDGTPLTPEQALFRYSNRYSIKPEFARIASLDEAQQTVAMEEMVTELHQVPATETVTTFSQEKKVRTEMKLVDGKQVPVQVEYTVNVPVQSTKTVYKTVPTQKLVCLPRHLLSMRVTDSRGNPIKPEDVFKRLKPGDACLKLNSDKIASAYPYLLKAKPDTVVFSMIDCAAIPGAGPPMAAQPMPAQGVPATPGHGIASTTPPVAMKAPPVAPAPVEPKPTVSQLTGHANPIQTVVHSPDGSQIATADGTFWKPGIFVPKSETMNFVTGKTLTHFPNETYVSSAAYSGDGTLLAGLSGNISTFKVWDAATGKEKLTNSECKTQIAALSISADGKWIATAGGMPIYKPNAQSTPNTPPTGELKIWNAVTGKLRFDLKGHEAPIRLMAFNPDGTRLATSDQSNTLRIWDTSTGDEQLSIVNDQGVYTTALAFSDKLVALGLSSNEKTSIRLINPTTGAPFLTITVPVAKQNNSFIPLEKIAFTADSRKLIVKDNPNRPVDGSGLSDTVWIFDVESGKQLNKIETGVKGGLNDSLRVSQDGGYFGLSSMFDAKPVLKVWETATGNLVKALEGQLTLVALKNGGQDALIMRAVELKQDYPPLAVKIWNTSTGAPLHSFEIPGNGIASIAYSGDGKRLAAAISYIDESQKQYYVGEVKVWDVVSGKELRSIKGIDGWLMSVGLNHDGKRVACCSAGSASKIWDVDSGNEQSSFPGASRMAFSADGKYIALSGIFRRAAAPTPGNAPPPASAPPGAPQTSRPIMSYPVVVFDAVTGKELYGLDGDGAVQFTPNSAGIATAGYRGISMWNAASGKLERTIQANVGSIVFSADGRYLLTVAGRSTFTVRTVADAKAISRLRLSPRVSPDTQPAPIMLGYSARGIPMSLSPNGRTLAVVSLDGKSVQFKDVSTLEPAGNEDIAPEEKASPPSEK